MLPKHLKTDELSYEILIRNVSVPNTVEEKRKILAGLLSQEASNRSFSDVSVNLSFDVDYQQALASYSDLLSLISDYSGTKSDSRFKAFSSRLTHLSGRISRLQPTSVDEEKLKKAIRYDLLKLEGTLSDIVDQPDMVDQPVASTPDRVNLNYSQSSASPVKSVPVYKWGIKKFSGKEPLIPFLEQIETLKFSRNCTDEDLFISAGDLFEGAAFTWWHNHFTKKSFNSWSELVASLKETYLPYNYERNLWEQIRSTKQSFKQPVSAYISYMESLMLRSSKSIPECEKVDEIINGLLPDYVKALAFQDVESVADLTKYCKRFEAALTISSRSKFSVESLSSSATCWNCNMTGHTFQVCNKPKRKFCHGCGFKNITTNECSRCSKNGLKEHSRENFSKTFKQPKSVNVSKKVIPKTTSFISNDNLSTFSSVQSETLPSSSTSVLSSGPLNSKVHLNSTSLLDVHTNDNRPYISISVGSETISALLDTGSNVSIIGFPSLFLLKKLKLALNYDVSSQLTTADGNIQSILGYVWLPVTLLSKTQSLKVLIVPSISHKMILGMDFIHLFKLCLDFSNFSFKATDLSTCVVNTVSSAENLSDIQQSQLNSVHRSDSVNVVTDSLSRIPEVSQVSLLNLSNLKTDAWYRNMIGKVTVNPNLYPAFKVQDDVLYKYVFSSSKFSDSSREWKIFVPSPHRKEILQIYHDDPTAAHLGVFKTLSRISELYYWPKMRSFVANYVHKCKVCASCKPLENISPIFNEVQKRIGHSYNTNTKRYNLGRHDVKFHVGAKVRKKNNILSKAVDDFSAKLAPKFIPCIIHKVLSPLVYNLKDLDGKDLGNFHVQDIKLDVTDSSDDESQ
ncbi:uncharacterized protein [Diabrotica undecimpunctata]|uniref:uncharacterized protein n=1 Tax=Diabrotica undecimpunctata TaxID=50387 RepID=UPI003B63E005